LGANERGPDGAQPAEFAMVEPSSRRNLIAGIVVAGLGTTTSLILPSALAAPPKAKHAREQKSEVTPPEDLMREHGVLDRVLLIYEAGMRKFSSNEDFDPALIKNAAEIVRDFIENYHEKSEEEAVFPRFKRAGKMVQLADVLLTQHQAGRRTTEVILRTAT